MNKLRKEQQQQAPRQERKGAARLPRLLVGILNGSFLTREKLLANMGFILFVAGLMIAYISYGYFTERTVRQLQATESELKELRSEYISVRADLEQAEQQSQVAEDIADLGLRESVVPPYKVPVDREKMERQ